MIKLLDRFQIRMQEKYEVEHGENYKAARYKSTGIQREFLAVWVCLFEIFWLSTDYQVEYQVVGGGRFERAAMRETSPQSKVVR